MKYSQSINSLVGGITESPTREIEEVLSDQHIALNNLSERVAEIRSRLSPVIRPMPSKDGAGCGTPVPPRSPVGSQIEENTHRIQCLRSELDIILETLAV